MKKISIGYYLFAMVLGLSAIMEIFTPMEENSIMNHALHSEYFIGLHIVLFVLGITGFICVKNFMSFSWVDKYHNLKIMNSFALFGFFLLIMDNFRQMRVDHVLAHQFHHASKPVQEAMLLIWSPLIELSPQNLLSLLILFLWILAMGFFLKNEKKISMGVFFIPLLSGILGVTMIAGVFFDIKILRIIGVLGNFPFTLIWFIYVGTNINRLNPTR